MTTNTTTQPASAGTLHLVSHALCPYVQRAAIALAEKGVPFGRSVIDLDDKPAWFQAISPLGRVPLLRVGLAGGGEEVLFESAAICEYLDETQPGVRLHPQDPLLRARHRAWMEFGSSVLADIWGLETARDQGTHAAKVDALRQKFIRVEHALSAHDGPWFEGARFSLVDAVFGPVFRYFDTFEALGLTRVLEGLPRVRHWRDQLAARPSVREAVQADYGQRLLDFLERQQAWMIRAQPASEGAALAA